jgi:hypothetical protein
VESEFFIKSLGLNLVSLVKIKNVPLLVSTAVVVVHTNSLTFNIFRSSNIKDLVVSPIDELVLLILEKLEPSRVGTPDLHVIGSTRALDIPRLIVISCSDCQRLLVEIPDLSFSCVWCLDDHVSVVDQVEVSLVW